MKNKKILVRLSALLVLLSILLSFVSCFSYEQVILTKEEITANIELESNTERAYVTTYLKNWKFPRFATSKLQGVEIVFRDYYVNDIRKSYDVAKDVSSLFLEYFYDEINLESEVEVTDALIYCYIETVGDRYSIYRTRDQYEDYSDELSGSFAGIGVTVIYDSVNDTIEIDGLVSGSGAEEVGIEIGDLIVAVDGERLEDIEYNSLLNKVRGEVGTNVDITVNRGGEEITYTIERRIIVETSVKYKLLDTKIGYIRITGFNDNTDEQFKEAVDYMKANGAIGVVYDLRTNPGGYLATVAEMLSYIAPRGTNIVSFSNDYSDPITDNDSNEFTIPTVVLCNGNTASAAELFTAAIRDFGEMGIFESSIVGETTYGKGVMQSSYPFTDGSVITLTVAYYYSPLGRCCDSVGIEPDIEITLTEEGDAQLDAALKTIEDLIFNN